MMSDNPNVWKPSPEMIAAYVDGELPADFGISFKERTLGFAAAWKMGTLSVGGAIRHQRLTPRGFTSYYGIVTNLNDPLFGHRLPGTNGYA